MKVLMINSVSGIRSTGRICTDLADILEKNGHECVVAYGRECAPEKYQHISYRIGNEFITKINGIKARLFDNEGFNAKRQTTALIDFIKKYHPDIIHLHNMHGYYLNIEILLKYIAEAKIPVVLTAHDCWTLTGHCSHFAEVGCEKWKTGCHRCLEHKAYPTSWVVDNSNDNWKRKKSLLLGLERLIIVTPSNWLASIFKASYLRNKRIEVIPNGVDLDVFKPTSSDFKTKHKLGNKKVILGVATAWGERKGLNLFIELAKRLGEEYKVVLVGLTPSQIEQMPCELLCIEKTNNVSELAEIYTAADVFINAGKEETMGLTTVEAMACGTPVVVSNLTAVPEVVDESGGLVFEEYSVDCILSSIKKVLSSKYEETRVNAKKFEKDKQYLKYIQLYEEIMDCKQQISGAYF